MAGREIVIVGAGMGGLALALRLAHRGHRVTVYEKTDTVGGRNRPVRVNDCGFDGGPTLLMMLDPFEKLFADVGERLQDHLKLTRMDPSYRVFYRDGTRLRGLSDRVAMREQIACLFGKDEATGFDRLMADLEAMYREAIPLFVRRNYDRLTDFANPSALSSVIRHRMVSNYARRITGYMQDPKLRMLFSFQTMYLGLSPFAAPWVYAVLTYMEYGQGIWYPEDGLTQLSTVMARLAEARGAKIVLNQPVSRVEGSTVYLESGESRRADAVVLNADLPYAESELLRLPAKKRTYSCSCHALYIDYHGSLPELDHHNVFFGADFRGNLDQIFNRLEVPEDPAFYAAVSCRSDRCKALPGHENLFVLVPCPNLDYPWSERDAAYIKSRVFGRLAEEVGFDPSRVAGMETFGPTEYATVLNLEKGAAFGLSHHFGQSAFMRPNNRLKSNQDVYFVGASTVPGNGLPMVLISAELVEQRLNARFDHV